MTDTNTAIRKRRVAVAAAAATVALAGVGAGVVAIAGADPTSPQPSPSSPATLPSVSDLDAKLAKAMDPGVPETSKRGLFEDEAQPQLVDPKMAQPGAPKFTYRVVDVNPIGEDRVNAVTAVAINGQENPNKAEVPFVYDNGDWKIDKTWACTMVENLGRPSPAC
ncbi:hypothetical protein [Nocardia farcinica]|uniref:hypothetical protein n=1 Tax=Nocardia farcinica TaxID=37329 RepID=UPI002457B244|nr:hypothetical protein [Nocardia farcinica]